MSQPVNPYVAGAPLHGERGFFGRQDTLDWVARELRNPATNALVLFGQRRIGKTTLLLQLERTLPAGAFLPVYFDLQDQAARPLGQVLADLADTVAERADLETPDPDSFDDRGRFFSHTFLPGLYTALSEARRPIFLFDEFDVLDQVAEAELPEEAAAKAFFPFLRRTMTEEARPAFVFVVGRRAEDLSLDFTSTFKASLVREIWVLDRESAEVLVRQAEANNTLRFTDRAVARILSLTSCHPYLTQLLCQRIWEQAYAKNTTAPPQIDVPEVEAAVPDALEAGDQALVWLWNGLGPAEKIYTAALAELADEGATIAEDQVIQVLSAHAARLRTREVELAPRDLVKRRVLEVAGEREYRFAVELFRRWVRRQKLLQEVKDELDRIEPVAEQLFGWGQGFFRQRQWETAIRYFRDALGVNPRHFRARLHLGEALLARGRVDEAVAELERAYELDREEARFSLVRALVAQARAWEEAGDEDGALAACDQALQISPNERAAQEVKAAIWTRRGDAALERDDLEAALAAYREAGDAGKIARVEVLQRRRELAALEAQAQAHERAERWAEATAVYEQLLAQAPDEENQAAWQTALERCREEEELVCLFAEGVGALEQQDWKEAERAFAEVMHHRPDYRRDGQPAARLLQRALSRETVAVPRRQYIQHLAIVLVAAVLLLVVGMWAANTFYFQPREVTRQAEATAQAVALATAARQTAVAQAATATAHAVTPQAATATAQAVALAATATADACRDITLYTLEVAPEPTLSPQPGRIYIIGTQCPVVQATWVVTNTGECPWKDVMLQPLAGGEAVEPILRRGEEEVERVEPGEQVEVVLEFPVHQARDVDREWVIKVGEFSLYDQTHLRLEVTDWVVVVTPTPTPTPCLPHALFVDDVTVPDGAIFAPEESFTKMWRVRSTGCWPPDTALVFVRGDQLGAPESVPVPDTPLGSTVDIAVKMVAPDTPGIYNGVWRMQTPDGTLFGDWFYVLIEVALPTPTVIP